MRGHPSTYRPLPLRLAYRPLHPFPPSTSRSFDSQFTPSCQSWQATNQRSPPKCPVHRLLFRLSTKYVFRLPGVKVALTTDFPVLQLPVLYVVRSSIWPIANIRPPLIGLLPTDRRLCCRYLRGMEHTGRQESDQSPQTIRNRVARALSHHRGECRAPPSGRLPSMFHYSTCSWPFVGSSYRWDNSSCLY